jgi:hypothetical protein
MMMIPWCLFRLLRLLLPLLRNAMGNIPCAFCSRSCLFCYCNSRVFEHNEIFLLLVAIVTTHQFHSPSHPLGAHFIPCALSFLPVSFLSFLPWWSSFSFLVLLCRRFLHHRRRRQLLISVVFLLLFSITLLFCAYCCYPFLCYVGTTQVSASFPIEPPSSTPEYIEKSSRRRVGKY